MFDFRKADGRGLEDFLRTFAVAVRLGWQLEANWTDPLLFFIYSVAKPVSSALILVVMLEVIGGEAGRAFRPFVVVGSALWAFVVSGIAKFVWIARSVQVIRITCLILHLKSIQKLQQRCGDVLTVQPHRARTRALDLDAAVLGCQFNFLTIWLLT